MPKLISTTTGLLILPNGQEIAPGETVDLPAEFVGNAGVASWVADGLAEIEADEPAADPDPAAKK